MARNYYYLVASLPDLLLDETRGALSFAGIVDEIVEQIHPRDRELFDFVRHPFDNTNVITLLDNLQRPFDNRGTWTREELESALKNPDVLPGYLQVYLEARKDGRELFAGLTAQDQLAWLFFDAAAEHRNEFVRNWFEFECDLRNVLAAAAAREYSQFNPERVLLRRSDTTEAIARSSAPDFSVGMALPWVEKVLAARRESLVIAEKTIDRLRWDMLNDFTTFTYFQVETLLAFALKLAMVERWRELEPAEGEKRLEALVDELLAGFSAVQSIS